MEGCSPPSILPPPPYPPPPRLPLLCSPLYPDHTRAGRRAGTIGLKRLKANRYDPALLSEPVYSAGRAPPSSGPVRLPAGARPEGESRAGPGSRVW